MYLLLTLFCYECKSHVIRKSSRVRRGGGGPLSFSQCSKKVKLSFTRLISFNMFSFVRPPFFLLTLSLSLLFFSQEENRKERGLSTQTLPLFFFPQQRERERQRNYLDWFFEIYTLLLQLFSSGWRQQRIVIRLLPDWISRQRERQKNVKTGWNRAFKSRWLQKNILKSCRVLLRIAFEKSGHMGEKEIQSGVLEVSFSPTRVLRFAFSFSLRSLCVLVLLMMLDVKDTQFSCLNHSFLLFVQPF